MSPAARWTFLSELSQPISFVRNSLVRFSLSSAFSSTHSMDKIYFLYADTYLHIVTSQIEQLSGQYPITPALANNNSCNTSVVKSFFLSFFLNPVLLNQIYRPKQLITSPHTQPKRFLFINQIIGSTHHVIWLSLLASLQLCSFSYCY